MSNLPNITLDTIFKFVEKNSEIKIYTSNKKQYNLNIFNIRAATRTSGKFDDVQIIFWRTVNGTWDSIRFNITADPSTKYLLNPINHKGTAIVAPGQYNGVWQFGLHKNQYEGLVQRKPLDVIRDNNKDIILNDLTYDQIKKLREYINKGLIDTTSNSDPTIISEYKFSINNVVYNLQKGYFGINCHRANRYKILETIGVHSAGCCVHNDYNRYINEFIPLIKKSVDNWGLNFTATWLNENDLINI